MPGHTRTLHLNSHVALARGLVDAQSTRTQRSTYHLAPLHQTINVCVSLNAVLMEFYLFYYLTYSSLNSITCIYNPYLGVQYLQFTRLKLEFVHGFVTRAH